MSLIIKYRKENISEIYATELLSFGKALTEVAIKVQLLQYKAKSKELKKKKIDKICNIYDEIINGLLNEREEAVRITQTFKFLLE